MSQSPAELSKFQCPVSERDYLKSITDVHEYLSIYLSIYLKNMFHFLIPTSYLSAMCAIRFDGF